MNISDWKSLPGDILAVFREFRIISVQDVNGKEVEGYTTANIRKARDAQGRVLGDGPLVAQDVLARLLDACKDSPQCAKWMRWMLVQAGGGEEAHRRANQAMDQVRERFLDERVRGYRDTKGVYHSAISREEAEALYAKAQPRFKEVLYVGDQDMAEKLQVFGFHRHWPGPNKVYEKCASAVKSFVLNLERTKEMNEFMRRSNMKEKVIALNQDDYKTVDSLEVAVKKVERFFASRECRQDIRIETVYEDDNVQVICPLTYAAAVLYGWETWSVADRNIFESQMEGTGTGWQDPWRKEMDEKKQMAVYFNFKVPMPSWISYSGNRFRRFTMHNLMVPVPKDRKQVEPGVKFTTEDGAQLPMETIISRITAEPSRVYDPSEEEYPVQRGPSVYESEDEAKQVVKSLLAGWHAVAAWQKTFDVKRIVVDYLPK